MIYFALCIFLSAFLIFQVQPIIARYILPWFGGTPAVWSTVMLFFQFLLTGGYIYAAWLTGKARRRQGIHLVFLGLSLALVLLLGLTWKSPITPAASWKPSAAAFPIWEIFKLLTISVGLPYFLLSTNSPLMQVWFQRAFPKKTAYRLYALSNIGSLLGLVTYPLLIEPNLSLAWQGKLWSWSYIAYVGLAAYGTIKTLRADAGHIPEPGPVAPTQDRHPAAKTILLWVALAAAASILLLATTSHITQEVAVIPFLWILPLTLYLLSFVFAFSGERAYSRQFYLILFFIATLLSAWAWGQSAALGIALQIGVYSLLLFAACMVCHGELYRLRPHPAHLTLFYVMVSVGGALGGLVINFVAPYIFKGYWELPLGIAVCWLLFLIVTLLPGSAPARKKWSFVLNNALLMSALAISGMRAFQQIRADLVNELFIQRNYYGVIRVRQLEPDDASLSRYALVHGITIHGVQFLDKEKHDSPTLYYGPTGGGLAILSHPERGQGMRVGGIGLGIGTLAAYGQPGDVYRFYEINPLVIRLAEGEGGYFSFLSDSRAKIEIIPGDARLSLEAELDSGQAQNYDVLVLDVFSSDAIPVHLIDAEAFDVYLQHLQPDGILAVHISNLHLDLVPVAWTLADHYNLSRVLIEDPGDGVITSQSLWVLMARRPELLANPAIASRAYPMEGYIPGIRLWTDDYSNLFQILRH